MGILLPKLTAKKLARKMVDLAKIIVGKKVGDKIEL